MKMLAHLAAAALALAGASAHDFALTPGMSEGGKVAVSGLYGHPGTWEQPDERRLVALDLHTPGAEQPVSILASVQPSTAGNLKLAASGEMPAGAERAIVTATYDNGFWVSLGDDEYFNTTKKMAPAGREIVKSSHNTKFAKLLLGSGSGFDLAAGQRLEIIPLADPAGLAAGAELPLRVLFDGEPLAGAEVNSGALGDPMGHAEGLPQTDADGTIRIEVGEPGMMLIRASHSVEGSEPDLADRDNFSATLVLRVGPSAGS